MQVWYVTFHGGDDEREWNNIHAFDLNGEPIGKALDAHSLPDDLELRELRGFAFGPEGDLFVANAYKRASQVLRFAGQVDSEGKHRFRDVFVEQHGENPGLAHPFDVAFGPDDNLYVPSQETNLVGRYFGPKATDGDPGHPMPHPEAIREEALKHALPGTFVPSQEHTPSGVRTVRRAIFGPDGDLYVADRDDNRVKRYDGKRGNLQREYKHKHLTSPVHIAFRPGDGALLVGSRDQDAIFSIDIESGETSVLVKSQAGGLKAPAGMAFGPDGKLYVCSRLGKQLLRYDAHTGEPDSAPFVADLEDAPEFIGLVGR